MHTDIDFSTSYVYYLNAYKAQRVIAMPRAAVKDNERLSMRVRAQEKAVLLRAATLENTDLTDFVLQHALRSAKAVIQQAEHIRLSARDSLRVLQLLENPPKPNARLRAAARALSNKK
jgi:uncharacterized protein (DUF1778 family)